MGAFVRNGEGVYVENSLSTFVADLMFKYRGFSILSEYANKVSEENLVDLTSNYNTGSGLTAQAGYLLPSNLEVAFRYTTISRDNNFSGIKDENQFTLGLSKYIVGHSLKVQTDLTRITFPNLDDGRYQFRMQMEMQF